MTHFGESIYKLSLLYPWLVIWSPQMGSENSIIDQKLKCSSQVDLSNKQWRKSRQKKEMNIKREKMQLLPLLYSNDLPFFPINYLLKGNKDLLGWFLL